MQFRVAAIPGLAVYLSFLALDATFAHPTPKNPYPNGSIPDPSNRLEVNLGYAGYVGVNNATSGLNSWHGYVRSFTLITIDMF